MLIDTSGLLSGSGGQGQGHTRPKLDFEAWRSHHFRPLGWSSFSIVLVIF